MKHLALAATLALVGVTQLPLRGLTAEEAAILSHLSLEQVPDGQGGMVPTLVVTGLNVQIVNGLGQTHTANGAGNLILGYNETGHPLGDDRTGSHYLVFGKECNYSAAAGLVGGEQNWAMSAGGSILGGSANEVGQLAGGSVLGAGFGNVVNGAARFVAGNAGAPEAYPVR